MLTHCGDALHHGITNHLSRPHLREQTVMDKLPRERRSLLMARIRSKDTAPEWTVRRLVHAMGYRYRLHDRRLPGTPDLVFPSRRKVIFVHGCFWHGHDCPRGFKPKTNADFWASKISKNRARDAQQLSDLTALGWQVLVIWECAIHRNAPDDLKRTLTHFLAD